MGHLVVRNHAQKVLFEEELKGQISDGMWENSRPHEHWRAWSDAKVRVAGPGEEDLIGRNFWAPKDNYNFASKDLLDVVGDRMVQAVFKDQIERGVGIPEYTRKDLMADLKDLKEIIRIRRSATVWEQGEDAAERAADEARRVAARAQLTAQAEELNALAKELGLRQHWSEFSTEARFTRQAHELVTALMARTDELERANLANHLTPR